MSRNPQVKGAIPRPLVNGLSQKILQVLSTLKGGGGVFAQSFVGGGAVYKFEFAFCEQADQGRELL